MKKLLASIALVSAAGISLTACGGGGSAKADDPVSKNAKTTLAAAFTKDAAAEGSDNPITADVSGCVANGIVDQVGAAKLTEYKVIDTQGAAIAGAMSTIKASKDDATKIVDVLFGCVGADKLVGSMTKSVDEAGDTTPQSVKDCVKGVYTKDNVRTLLIASLQGSDSEEAKKSVEPLGNQLKACTTQGTGSTN